MALRGHNSPVTRLCAAGDSLLSADECGAVWRWELRSFAGAELVKHSEPITSLVEANGQIYYSSGLNAYAMDPLTNTATLLFSCEDEINDLAYHESKQLLASADDTGRISIFDCRNKRFYKKLRSKHDNVRGITQVATALSFHPTKQWNLWSGACDCTVIEWDISNGKKVNQIAFSTVDSFNPPYVHSLALSKKRTAFGLGNGEIHVYQQNKLVSDSRVHNWTVSCL
jgi:WD40 repeat protein